MTKALNLLPGFFLLICLAAMILLFGCSSAGTGKPMLHCPMHPQVTSDKPGDCPICGMKLVPVQKAGEVGEPAPTATEKGKAELYICPMHPDVTSDRPSDCNICGMHLVKKETGDVAPATDGIPGLAPVSLDGPARKRMNLATSPVEMRHLSRELRTSARILPDETRLHRVTAKVEGYVERLFVNVTGQQVKRGQPLLSIYSPELLASQQEFLSALAASKRLGASPYPTISKGGQELVEAARQRLKLWDISDDQVERLEKSGTPEKFVTLYAPASGFVSEKSVLPGQKIMPGEPLLVIADLSRIWADADIYESDLRYIKVGMPVTLTLPYWPGREFPGKVSFLNPFLDPMARTMKARLEIPNGDLLLKPEMYGDMVLSYDQGERLAVPESAVMRNGKKTVVFIESGEGGLTPAEVAVGERSEGYYEILSGLKAGDRVVTSANFLVDSESSLKAALLSVKN